MAPKFSKLEEKVEELYTNNISISTISTILKKPKSSIYTAIRRIKDKKRTLIRIVLI
jgi:transposase